MNSKKQMQQAIEKLNSYKASLEAVRDGMIELVNSGQHDYLFDTLNHLHDAISDTEAEIHNIETRISSKISRMDWNTADLIWNNID